MVATFTDTNPQAVAGDFAATIAWGDGTSAAPDVTHGTVLVQADGAFAVTGNHTYFAASSGFPVTVIINDTKDGTAATA